MEKENAKDTTVEVIRTRDMEIINKADFVVDVGGVYDEVKNRFDHHQREGAGKRDNNIPYASFGLVWKKYGQIISGSKEIAREIEQKMVIPIDAIDVGVAISKPIFPATEHYTITDLFVAFHITWKENSDELDSRFMYLTEIAKKLIQREITKIKDKKEAKNIVSEIYNKIEDKRLIILDRYYPWHEVISSHDDTLLVIFPSINNYDWVLEVVTNEDNFINSRISLPESWAGRRDEDLESVTGIIGSVFCHNGRFLAVAKTKEAAIKLAHIALEEAGK